MGESTQTKVCTKCGVDKPTDQFHRRSNTPLGVVSQCKPCVKARNADRYQRSASEERLADFRERSRVHRESLDDEGLDERRRRNREYMKRRYAERRAEVLAKQNAARESDPERFREYARKFREANPEKFQEWNRQSRLANPDGRAEHQGRRRARKLETQIGPVDLDALWTGTCGICDLALDEAAAYPQPSSKSLDHIVPLARGGTHTQDNLQWAHLACNLRKGARLT